MKILSAAQIRQWDQFTIQQEPVSSTGLMERAATACFEWLDKNDYTTRAFSVFCGRGNNGGDGLAIARMLAIDKQAVTVYILDGPEGSPDFRYNLTRLQELPVTIHTIRKIADLPRIPHHDVIIECLFGTGLNRPLTGFAASLVSFINESGNEVISIDMPGGLFADTSSAGNSVIKAGHTLTFQAYKLALLLPENEAYTGHVHLLDIGLDKTFLQSVEQTYTFVDLPLIKSMYKPRKSFAHKGTYGHTLLIAGSHGKMGAAVMAATSCLRTGAGLLTVFTPASGNIILQTSLPEAMVLTDVNHNILTTLPDETDKYATIAIGPGIGTASETGSVMAALLQQYRHPVVVDADGLNILAAHPNLLSRLPVGSVLTPHPKEFERLFGKSLHDFDRLQLALEQAKALRCTIVLKGHHTFIALPDGQGYFNSTGNAGMAKGGSGDVLTGMIAGLISQGYSPQQAAIMGVYLHGLAGDLAARQYGMESMLPTDLIAHIGRAFMAIQ